MYIRLSTEVDVGVCTGPITRRKTKQNSCGLVSGGNNCPCASLTLVGVVVREQNISGGEEYIQHEKGVEYQSPVVVGWV